VALPLLFDGYSRKKAIEAAESQLEQVGLADYRHSPPLNLSGGQRRRGISKLESLRQEL
jgi:energy-coupling factor transporter ATP-binding protein EcfA2